MVLYIFTGYTCVQQAVRAAVHVRTIVHRVSCQGSRFHAQPSADGCRHTLHCCVMCVCLRHSVLFGVEQSFVENTLPDQLVWTGGCPDTNCQHKRAAFPYISYIANQYCFAAHVLNTASVYRSLLPVWRRQAGTMLLPFLTLSALALLGSVAEVRPYMSFIALLVLHTHIACVVCIQGVPAYSSIAF